MVSEKCAQRSDEHAGGEQLGTVRERNRGQDDARFPWEDSTDTEGCVNGREQEHAGEHERDVLACLCKEHAEKIDHAYDGRFTGQRADIAECPFMT